MKFPKIGLHSAFLWHLLVYVIVDDVLFNLELVSEVLSPYYSKYVHSRKYDRKFRGDEQYERKNKLGIWGNPELTQKYLRLKSKWGQRSSQQIQPKVMKQNESGQLLAGTWYRLARGT